MYSGTEDKWDGNDPRIWALQKRYKEVPSGMPAPVAEPDAEVAAAEAAAAEGAPAGAAAAAGGMGGMAMPAAAAGAGFAPIAAATDPAAAVANRQQAYYQLQQITEFLAATEPHSPVIPLLRRALAWSQKPYHEIYEQLLGRFPEPMAYVWDTLGLNPDGTPAEGITVMAPSQPVQKAPEPEPEPEAAAEPEKSGPPAGLDVGGADDEPAADDGDGPP